MTWYIRDCPVVFGLAPASLSLLILSPGMWFKRETSSAKRNEQSSALKTSSFLCSSASKDHDRDCESNKLQVLFKRLFLKIINIHLYHAGKRDSTPSIDLPVACQAWFPI